MTQRPLLQLAAGEPLFVAAGETRYALPFPGRVRSCVNTAVARADRATGLSDLSYREGTLALGTTAADYRAWAIRTMRELGMIGCRFACRDFRAGTGVNGSNQISGGGTDFAPTQASIQHIDDWVAETAAAGLTTLLTIPPDVVNNPDSFGPTWLANWRKGVKWAAGRYGARSALFVMFNEPDTDTPDAWDPPTAASCVSVHQEIQAGVREAGCLTPLVIGPFANGPEVATVGGQYVEDCIAQGITRYGDFLGQNCYRARFHDWNNAGAEATTHAGWAWKHMQDAYTASAGAYPVLPLVVLEWGVTRAHAPAWTATALANTHHWSCWQMLMAFVQLHRWGIQEAEFYTLQGSSNLHGGVDENDFPASWPDAWRGAQNLTPSWYYDSRKTDEFWTFRNYVCRPEKYDLRWFDGSFEAPQETIYGSTKLYPWLVQYDPIDSTQGTGDYYRQWARVLFKLDGLNARTGVGYVEMNEGGVGDTGGKNAIRRLVLGLTPGVEHRLRAWVKLTTGATATLAALGTWRVVTNAVATATGNPYGDIKATTSTTGTWVQLEVKFTPQNPWVVISLEHNGVGTAYWDDVNIT